ncbi:MAG: hypothetical protein GY856_52585, partial [bacterium]|nr:hypothetical protein [bacterium]
FDIRGLNVEDLYDAEPRVDLAGGVVFALGCHGGLPVAGSDAGDGDHSLDLPQTMLSLGVLSYVANTGYGWGLKHGVGYGERLLEILTEEMTPGGTVVTGDAVKRAKQRYFLETPRFDPYDEKSLMQWSFFGLPMVAVRTGIRPDQAGGRDEAAGPFEDPPPQVGPRPAVERFGPVSVARRLSEGEPGESSPDRRARPRASLPKYLTRLDLHFDFTADGVYTKRNALGAELPDTPGCPQPPPGEPEGCYYTLNGLVERGTGETDLPIQPYFIYDSRLSGTSQHGVLWNGGVYEQETGWVPVIAELVSNGGDGSDHGATPQTSTGHPTSPRLIVGRDPDQCRPSDRELNSLVVTAEEVLKDQETNLTYSIERHYREVELEVFYFNNSQDALENCDRTGPVLASGPHDGDYHLVRGREITWTVPATDEAGVWRVVVVVNDGTVDDRNRGTWEPLELRDEDGTGTWRGSLPVSGVSQLTYVVQAVDRRGNVTWLKYENVEMPASGVPLDLPLRVKVDLLAGEAR